MGEVITFDDFRPPARFDAIPWTAVQIEESADGTTAWTQIDYITLTPLDTDPSVPMLRSFTTENGTAPDLWYRVLFQDATSDVSQATTPIQNEGVESVPPIGAYSTTDELFRILKIRQPTPAQLAAGQRVLDASALEIDTELGRSSPYAEPPALVVEVCLERAVEHWRQEEAPFGILGFDSTMPTPTGRDSWDRHAYKLAPLKESWGIG